MYDKPNVVIPLAASYNERGVTGSTTVFTDGVDQRKINSFYELITNSVSGSRSLYLTKRPGVTIDANSYGATGQVGYLVALPPGSTSAGALPWVFSVSGNDVRASSTSTTTVIVTAANYFPSSINSTAISGTENVVVQLRSSADNNLTTTWFSSAIATFTQITDGDFTGLTTRGRPEFMDGYMFVMDSANRVFNSDLNSLANWTATNYITKQIVQDVPTGLARLGNQILAFGAGTMEVFTNAGNATGSPLSPVKQLFQRTGIGNPNFTGATSYYATLGGRIYFKGRNSKSINSEGAFTYNGSTVEKISTPAIDKILTESTVYSVNVLSFAGKDAIAFGLDLTTASTQRWLMFFPSINEWFEWNSTVFTPVSNGSYFLGIGANQHKVYTFAMSNNWQDAGTNYTMTHQFQLPSDGNERKFMPFCAVKGNTARSAQNLNVEFSDDDYQTFQTARTIDMTSSDKKITRCGSWKGQRVVRLSHTGNTEVRLQSFLARVN